jgi:hypothetical protein
LTKLGVAQAMEMENSVDLPTDGPTSESAGEFFMGPHIVVDKKWMNWTLFIFSAADSALFVISTVQDIDIDDTDPEQVPDRVQVSRSLMPPPRSPSSLCVLRLCLDMRPSPDSVTVTKVITKRKSVQSLPSRVDPLCYSSTPYHSSPLHFPKLE